MTVRKKIWVAITLLAVLGLAVVAFWLRPIGLNNYVNKITLQAALASPQLLTELGLIDDGVLDFHSGRLDDYTAEFEQQRLLQLRQARAGLDRYGPQGLQGQELLTWQITAWYLDEQVRQGQLDFDGYRVNQISGVTIELPQFLTDQHLIKSQRSVQRYLARLREFGRVLREVKQRVEDDRAKGIVPPDFIIDQSIAAMRSFVAGGASENVLVKTLPAKLDKVAELSADERLRLLERATELVRTEVIPGYAAMIGLFEQLRLASSHEAGLWRLPNGQALYAAALRSGSTTDLSAQQIHDLGLEEVARIESELRVLLDAEGLPGGSLAERVRRINERLGQIFPDSEAGRQEMIAYLKSVDARVMDRAATYFRTIPPQPLEIVRVPVYAQDSSPGGYYMGPALDGSRPGRFYINQKSTADLPRFGLPTLMVHEGSPGHHFQISAAQLVTGVPLLRKVLSFNAYAEGWALYAERLAKTDMGLYEADRLGDIGRLQAEMLRAVRLVVDTGIHAKRWSRERAVQYMLEKTGMSDAEVIREVDRYVVWPGQATGYKLGQMVISRLREQAQQALGTRFDLRDFHEEVLMNGAMPLAVLEQRLGAWIQTLSRR